MAGRSEKMHLIALFQGEAKVGDVPSNISKMKEQIRKASSMGAELVIFPEMFLTGYELGAAGVKRLAEERSGPSFQELSAAAKEVNIAVVYGYPELDLSSGSAVYYNSAQLIDSSGSSLANYRKVHIWIDEYKYEEVFSPGSGFTEVVECCGMKIGLLICFDIEFPEAARALALRGAQVIAVPTALTKEWEYANIISKLVPARAMENRVYVAYVNHCGRSFCGRTVCCNPHGNNLSLTSVEASPSEEENLLLASIMTPIQLDSTLRYLEKRRPALYGALVAQ